MTSRKRCLEEEKGAERKRPKVTSKHGLINQGATCYLNSVLQVLFRTTEIHDRLDSELHSTDQELKNVFETLEGGTCGTENITKSLAISNVYKQRDAAECLEMILRKVNSKVSKVFEGELTHLTKCSKDHVIIEETNPFWTLPLSLKDTDDTDYSVEMGFKMTFRTKSFNKGNMVYCNDCGKKTESTSECRMVKCPRVLILLLKRFDFDINTMSHVKSNRSVDVPGVLQRENKTYELYAMVNHMGSLMGGHYTATIQSREEEAWYEYDDIIVRKVKEQPFANNKTYSSSSAYLLMYRDLRSLRDQQDDKPTEQKRHKPKQRRKSSQKVADRKENRLLEQNQEDKGQKRSERKKDSGVQLVPRHEGYSKLNVPSFKGEKTGDDALYQKTSHLRKQSPDGRATAGRTQISQITITNNEEEEDTKCPQLRRGLNNLKKNPVWLVPIFFVVVVIVIIPIIIVTLRQR